MKMDFYTFRDLNAIAHNCIIDIKNAIEEVIASEQESFTSECESSFYSITDPEAESTIQRIYSAGNSMLNKINNKLMQATNTALEKLQEKYGESADLFDEEDDIDDQEPTGWASAEDNEYFLDWAANTTPKSDDDSIVDDPEDNNDPSQNYVTMQSPADCVVHVDDPEDEETYRIYRNTKFRKDSFKNESEYKKAVFDEYKKPETSKWQYKHSGYNFRAVDDILPTICWHLKIEHPEEYFAYCRDPFFNSPGINLNETIRNFARLVYKNLDTFTVKDLTILFSDFGNVDFETVDEIYEAMLCVFGYYESIWESCRMNNEFQKWKNKDFIQDETTGICTKKTNN